MKKVAFGLCLLQIILNLTLFGMYVSQSVIAPNLDHIILSVLWFIGAIVWSGVAVYMYKDQTRRG